MDLTVAQLILQDRKMAYAITVQGPQLFDEPVDVARINGHGKAPQSWTFHDDAVLEDLW